MLTALQSHVFTPSDPLLQHAESYALRGRKRCLTMSKAMLLDAETIALRTVKFTLQLFGLQECAIVCFEKKRTKYLAVNKKHCKFAGESIKNVTKP